jgi:hypothetical protein
MRPDTTKSLVNVLDSDQCQETEFLHYRDTENFIAELTQTNPPNAAGHGNITELPKKPGNTSDIAHI